MLFYGLVASEVNLTTTFISSYVEVRQTSEIS